MPGTPFEIQVSLAERLKARRIALGWTQQIAAQRSGVAYRTWRRLETEGKASLEDVIKAAVALRCEGGFKTLFPPPAATSLDGLLKRQSAKATSPVPGTGAQVATLMKVVPGAPLAASLRFDEAGAAMPIGRLAMAGGLAQLEWSSEPCASSPRSTCRLQGPGWPR